jgi:hypothetical protein
VRPIVGLDPAHPALAAVECRRPPVEPAGRLLAERQRGVEARHLPKACKRRAATRLTGREAPRSESQVAADLRQERVAIAKAPVQRGQIAEPLLDQKAVAVARDRGDESGRVQRTRPFQLARAFPPEPGELE